MTIGKTLLEEMADYRKRQNSFLLEQTFIPQSNRCYIPMRLHNFITISDNSPSFLLIRMYLLLKKNVGLIETAYRQKTNIL
jgi:hypothetical protein